MVVPSTTTAPSRRIVSESNTSHSASHRNNLLSILFPLFLRFCRHRNTQGPSRAQYSHICGNSIHLVSSIKQKCGWSNLGYWKGRNSTQSVSKESVCLFWQLIFLLFYKKCGYHTCILLSSKFL